MLNKQKYLPMGMNPNFINETEVRKCIEEGTIVSGKVVEYDILEKTFTINICDDNVKGVLFNDLWDSNNTAASYVGRIINITISDTITESGAYVCNIDPHFYDAQDILSQYQEGCALKTIVATITGFGAMLDAGLGTSALIHLNELRKAYGENISNPSEALKLGDIIDVYVHHTEEGKVQFTLQQPETVSKIHKRYGFVDFLKSKIAS